ncbi:phage head closure protein [Bacillus safensis]|uniref:phage head closure protein n=1 Tax=Bacillus safensis TaxID=561879 RepID=UPI0022AB61BD|nr:phage head closure protein [Bacillus safensis]WAT79639.1 phage head closure protein [Bacillus safensis]
MITIFSDVIELIKTSAPVEDELGQLIDVEMRRQVFCERKSVPQNEFFQAGISGKKAAHVFEVHKFDYQEELKVSYKNKVYHIYRTYEKSDEKIELYCEVRAG